MGWNSLKKHWVNLGVPLSDSQWTGVTLNRIKEKFFIEGEGVRESSFSISIIVEI
jgi:hypothetical protein